MRQSAVVGVLLMLASALPLVAQEKRLQDDPALAPLRREALLIWLVSHQPKPVTKTTKLPTTSAEQTAGSFGQTSSSVGTTAGGTGQTAGDFGRTSSSVGATAGSTGQTAGSFGVSTGQLAAQASGARAAADPLERMPPEFRRRYLWDASVLRGPFPRAHFVDIGDGELAERLQATAGTDDAPDVLVGSPLPPVWSAADSGLAGRYGARMLAERVRVPQTEGGDPIARRTQAAILLKARHPAAAGAYVIWLRDRTDCLGCWVAPPEMAAPIEVAGRVLHNVLSGQRPGSDADPEMAEFDASIAAMIALGYFEPGFSDLTGAMTRQAAPLDLNLDTVVTGAWRGERLAVVQLRGVVSSASAFGVVHAVAVLRPDADGRWRVLQLTPNLDIELAKLTAGMISPYAVAKPWKAAGAELGVSLAAPLDGDGRGPRPELWWDNAGGATLQVVEWQLCGKVCTGTNLYFIPDANARLHTRAVARFADVPGRYRWRVWSLAAGGGMVLSPWRTLNILQQ